MVELQGSAEGMPFSEAEFMQMLNLARKGMNELIEAQKAAIA